MQRKSARENPRLPIGLDTTSNGEFEPVPLGPVQRLANRLAHERASHHAGHLGVSRRGFLVSACGAASSLLAMNDAFARAGRPGGRYEVPREAAFEPQLAEATVGGDEFIFDVQGHYVNPDRRLARKGAAGRQETHPRVWSPKAACALAEEPGDRSWPAVPRAQTSSSRTFSSTATPT